MSSSSPDVVEARSVPRGTAPTALPNLLSLFRIAFVPVVVVLLMWTERGPRLAAAICFMIACITDYFDGWLARRRHSTTGLGQCLRSAATCLPHACCTSLSSEVSTSAALPSIRRGMARS